MSRTKHEGDPARSTRVKPRTTLTKREGFVNSHYRPSAWDYGTGDPARAGGWEYQRAQQERRDRPILKAKGRRRDRLRNKQDTQVRVEEARTK